MPRLKAPEPTWGPAAFPTHCFLQYTVFEIKLHCWGDGVRSQEMLQHLPYDSRCSFFFPKFVVWVFQAGFPPRRNTHCCYTLSPCGHERGACRGAISRLSVGSFPPLSPILPATRRVLNLLKLLGVASAALSAVNAASPACWALLEGPRIRGIGQDSQGP